MYVIGIDVGTGSVRAGVFDLSGRMLGSAKAEITIWRDEGSIVEQSSEQIWASVCNAVRLAVRVADIPSSEVSGIGVDATCSLVVLGTAGVSLPVSSDDRRRNVIVWMDHRAKEQAQRINATAHPVLKYVGGAISPEMETPKLLWLKENRPEVFNSAWAFFDLADFLTWKATGSLARSTCTLTCKWTYLAHEKRWDDSYFNAIGLGTLADEGFSRIGTEILEPGSSLAQGLTADAAGALGLPVGTPVAAGVIDAHAGGIGTVGAVGTDPTQNLAYVFGTSSCTMTTTTGPMFVPGVWGPYHSAMVPGMWLNEGGQSAAGAAIDHLLTLHPAFEEASSLANADGIALPVWLANRATTPDPSDAVYLATGLLVVPEFMGNRAPFANPEARGLIAGIGMDRDIKSLTALYVAGICGLGYGLRQIIDAQGKLGAKVQRILISGGAGSHDLVRQLLADATGLPVVATDAEEPVLLGSAILGAVAGGHFSTVGLAMAAMSRAKATFNPARTEVSVWHSKAFCAFETLQNAAHAFQWASKLQIGPK